MTEKLEALCDGLEEPVWETCTPGQLVLVTEIARDDMCKAAAALRSQREHIRRQAEDIMTLGSLVYAPGSNDTSVTWKERAEKAEAERDEFRSSLSETIGKLMVAEADRHAEYPVTREDLVIAAERCRAALAFIAGHLSRDEGDQDETEDEFGLDVSEIIEMAHDNMILHARAALDDPAVKAVFEKILEAKHHEDN